ncbi:N-acyl-D-amino-acid deacylase [Constrictibacter sp. MBR-5]|jgi:N-acyl-D-aspartate/D-glutamate deacylase|uniref:N-acyl-D-amino-acid deacylase family protein n=1 Tax=Constrictibacter sp. MBR-5 TaxID=3156467 RepID=UPI003398A748
MHDLVIRGGTLVDGTGRPAFSGDLAVDGDRIAAVGGKVGPGRREVDASGLLVSPGWVDIHTHYDGQAMWDPELAPSSWHGATTVMFGNCGVGFAPVRPKDRECLIDLMEGVEDIPGIVLAEGLKWNWETFPEYLDALEQVPRTIDVAAQMPHHPLRVYVMGERAVRRELATSDDIEAMHLLTEEAMRAGAFGFTTSRTESHRTTTGDLVPARNAAPEELLGIGKALGKVGTGAFGMLNDFEDEAAEFTWMRKQAHESGRPVWFLLTDRNSDPGRWRRLMGEVRQAQDEGAAVMAQVCGRAVGVILGLMTSLSPFTPKPTFAEIAKLPTAERMLRLRDPAVRRAILDEPISEKLLSILPPLQRVLATEWSRIFLLSDPPDYEPEPDCSIAALAARDGKAPAEYAYDYLVDGDGDRLLYFPVTNYASGDHEPIREMLTDKHTLLGLGDGGAHVGVICDASLPTFMLTHWVRDRKRGERLPLEMIVKRQTSATADFFGLHDRGRLEVGKRADINLIDYAALRLHIPKLAYDLPAGGKRLVQRVDGYVMTIVAGTPIFERGHATGAMPGKLVRSTRL